MSAHSSLYRRTARLAVGLTATPYLMTLLAGCATPPVAAASASAALAVPASAPVEMASACSPEFAQSVAASLSAGVTVKRVANGPDMTGGVKYVPATERLPAYCKVTGSFVTNPATGKTANFMAVLPVNWNGKYLQIGCGGHCGSFIVNDPTSALITISAQGTPGQIVAKGYAAFSTDEGHEGGGGGDWAVRGPNAVDQDAIDDFLYRADETLSHMGKAFTVAFYSRVQGQTSSIARSYFAGCSGGGRDAMVAASYFPEQFDGIIAGSPYGRMDGNAFQAMAYPLAALRAGADVPPSVAARVDRYVIAACDETDGVKDGLIQNPAACDFRPERDLPKCADGGATDQCFTQGQIETLSVQMSAITDERGALVQPGLSVSNFQYAYRQAARPVDPEAGDPWPDGAQNAAAPSMYTLGTATVGVFTHRNAPGFNPRGMISFRSGGPGAVTNFRAVVPREEVDRTARAVHRGIGYLPDNLRPFIRQDRKLLIWHNLSDEKLTPYMSVNYYKTLAARNGGYDKLQDNVRLFTLPGTTHCSITGFGPNNFDALTAMENWVEHGQAPNSLLASLTGPRVAGAPARRTMPLCMFPQMAHYRGEGDVNEAENWTCPAGDTSMTRVGESGRQAGVVD